MHPCECNTHRRVQSGSWFVCVTKHATCCHWYIRVDCVTCVCCTDQLSMPMLTCHYKLTVRTCDVHARRAHYMPMKQQRMLYSYTKQHGHSSQMLTDGRSAYTHSTCSNTCSSIAELDRHLHPDRQGTCANDAASRHAWTRQHWREMVAGLEGRRCYRLWQLCVAGGCADGQ